MLQPKNEQEFLEYVVRAIVSHPEEVSSEKTVDEMGTLYFVSVNKDDVKKVIGKQGKIAKAIRLLLRTVGFSHKVRATMKVKEVNQK
jgi:hypothetical protein